jgi:single-strand DNA-binding protein
MSGYLNKATLIGNLGADPEVRTTATGTVVTFSIATSESWKDARSGERMEKTEWHRCVIWNENLGRIAETYLHKGAKVYVEGAIRTRRWQDQSGADRTSTEIHLSPYNGTLTFLDSKRDGDDRAPRRQPAPAGAGTGGGGGPASDEDSDIPF